VPRCTHANTSDGFPPCFALNVLSSVPLFDALYSCSLTHQFFATVANMSIELDTLGDGVAKSQLESPAVPGIENAIPVSRISTPLSRSQAPPQTQPEEIEAQASVKAANEDVDESNIAHRPIIEALKELVPKGSTSVLESQIHSRRTQAEAKLKCDGDHMMPGNWTPAAVWEHIGKMKSSDHGVLVINDVDDEWCEALCTKFPHAINRKFLLEHILGLENVRRTQDVHDQLSLERQLELSEVVDLEPLDRMFPCLMNVEKERFGDHIDCWLEPGLSEARTYMYEGCKLRRDPSGWTKINRFVSFCQLDENFCKLTYLMSNSS